MSVNFRRKISRTLDVHDWVPNLRSVTRSVASASEEEWPRIERDGFTIRVDPQCQPPLAFALSVARGLEARPRRLDASYLYDATGSALFERITEQPEYYLTRAEDQLLAQHAHAIREAAGPSTLLELGSGASLKTQRLLDVWMLAGPVSYVPVDVDAQAIEQACTALRRRYPDPKRVALRGIAATYERALAAPRGPERTTIAFLGSSLGNLGWNEYPAFCELVAGSLRPGDHFLVGVDLVKDPARIEAAYNDALGVTAAFTRNLFARMNRELHTRIPSATIEHVAYYDAELERVEIFAQATEEFSIQVPALGREFRIARGERILTEVSHKFRPAAFIATVERFGLRVSWETHENDEFGLFLFEKGKDSLCCARKPSRIAAELALLSAERARTLQIVAPLSEADLARQHSPLMSPIVWDLGHVAQFEEQWLVPAALRAAAPSEMGSLYDALATPRAERSKLRLPAVSEIWERLGSVRQQVERHFVGAAGSESTLVAELPAGEFSLALAVQHEAQHQETILQAIALRDDLPYRPSFASRAMPQDAACPVADRVLIPGGPFIMGTNDRARAYDNERPAHEVTVPGFRLGRAPVTNREYLAFIASGGYGERCFWSESGWDWLHTERAHAPAHWRLSQASDSHSLASWRALVFGRLEPLHPNGIVGHVSWFEAEAYARWVGGRLPSEAEWEKAAAWDPIKGVSQRFPWGDAAWIGTRANLDQERLEPARANAYPEGRSAYGCLQMLGDVWEWTDTWFDGYPGFESFPYREYSEAFFGRSCRVLRGGSFATRAVVARNTFRNWDLPQRRQIFAGFRCAWSA
jgi:gamma-glutamyl hercynylcysteine S-oxide synthase